MRSVCFCLGGLVVDHAFRYAARSRHEGDLVALSTSGGTALVRPSPHPTFFAGFLTRPDITALGLQIVGRVAATSFVLRGPQVAALDPVVTAHADRLRFESFSACGGVQARLDLLPDGYDGDILDRGTTNVDVNEPLRRFLARVRRADTLRIAVGDEGLTVTSPTETHVERRVPLSSRWLRGFAEVQAIAAGFEPQSSLPGATAARFVQGLPKAGAGWVVPAAGSLRLASRPVPGSVYLAGTERLRALEPLLRHAVSVTVHGPIVDPSVRSAPSAWEVVLPGARFVLTLSPDPHRGFSGEGAVLDHLLGGDVLEDADLVHSLLAFESRLDVGNLSDRSGLPAARVRSSLSALAVSGRVGFDVAESAYFHRELPYSPAAVEALNPRLRDARDLVRQGRLRVVDADGEAVMEVTGVHGRYRVRARPDGTYACTCRWWTANQGSRGPCKHVLATKLARGGHDDLA